MKYSGTINLAANSIADKSREISILQDDPLSDLIFADDSYSRYEGIQDGNTFYVTGVITNGKNTAEFLFTNVPKQLAGEMISYNFEADPVAGTYNMEVRQCGNPRRLAEYKNIRDRNSDLGIWDQKGTYLNYLKDFKQGTPYNIHLEWNGFSADYYVIFEIYPAEIPL